MTRFGSIYAFAATLALAGCASSAPRDISFGPASPIGLVAFGLAPEVATLRMYVAPIDPATCRLRSGGSKNYNVGELTLPFRPHQRGFVVDDLRPGHYVVTSILESGGYLQFSHTFESGAMAFEIVAGRISYLGDFALTSTRARPTGFDEAALREHLTRYPRVSGEPVRTEIVTTTFAYERDGPRIPGCTLRPND